MTESVSFIGAVPISHRLNAGDVTLFINAHRNEITIYLPKNFYKKVGVFQGDETVYDLNRSVERTAEHLSDLHDKLDKQFMLFDAKTPVEKRLYNQFMKSRCKLTHLSYVDFHCANESLLHNVLVSLLESGFYQSYDELCSLSDEAYNLSCHSLFVQSEEIIQSLKNYLMEAETYCRKFDFQNAYGALNHLAFELLQYEKFRWMVYWFFNRCLDIAQSVDEDAKKSLSEAYCNVAIAKFFQNDLHGSQICLEMFKRLSYKQPWAMRVDDMSYYRFGCLMLQHTYTLMADESVLHDNIAVASDLYLKAASMASESQNISAEIRAHSKLGEMHELSHDWSKALECYEILLTLSERLFSYKNLCQACFKLAICHQHLGNIGKAADYLRKCQAIGYNEGYFEEVLRSGIQLGYILMDLNENIEACDQFKRAYTSSVEAGVYHSLETSTAALFVGAARARDICDDFLQKIYHATDKDLCALLAWKLQRVQ